ncbi:MAG: zf-HC2 domain-containing protein [Kutzneria sp.]|nr:zf-HC2 domain-containing protein [Kutzneria sp.]MBV9845713.1 zf-HC2 domain-containing protein [Kutzneria sp.]
MISGNHVSAEALERYVRGEEGFIVLEAHLESCSLCRAKLTEAVAAKAPHVTRLINDVWSRVDTSMPAGARQRRWIPWLATWATPAMQPWFGMTVLVAALAWVLDHVAMRDSGYPAVLLLAPIAPVLAVAASWARGADPAHELVAATPRAGLYLVLRRTVAVMALVMPTLLAFTLLEADIGAALWMAPCVALTIGTLALGSVIELTRAAYVLIGLWTASVIIPSLVTGVLSEALEPASLPDWIVAIAVCGAVLVTRADAYCRLSRQA